MMQASRETAGLPVTDAPVRQKRAYASPRRRRVPPERPPLEALDPSLQLGLRETFNVLAPHFRGAVDRDAFANRIRKGSAYAPRFARDPAGRPIFTVADLVAFVRDNPGALTERPNRRAMAEVIPDQPLADLPGHRLLGTASVAHFVDRSISAVWLRRKLGLDTGLTWRRRNGRWYCRVDNLRMWLASGGDKLGERSRRPKREPTRTP